MPKAKNSGSKSHFLERARAIKDGLLRAKSPHVIDNYTIRGEVFPPWSHVAGHAVPAKDRSHFALKFRR